MTIAIKQGYAGLPLYLWTTRQLYGYRAMFFRMKARIHLKEIMTNAWPKAHEVPDQDKEGS